MRDLKKINKLIAIKSHQKSVYKDKNKKHKAFDAEVNNSDDDDFFSEFKEKKNSTMRSLLCSRRLL